MIHSIFKEEHCMICGVTILEGEKVCPVCRKGMRMYKGVPPYQRGRHLHPSHIKTLAEQRRNAK
jgi:uncharacterized Zn finger protein (UPF0148 family)